MLLVDNIGTNTFGANILRIKQVQSDVVIIEQIVGVQEKIILLILQISPRRVIILSNNTHDIINGNVVHTQSPSY